MMTIAEAISLVLGFVAGLVLGAIFFGGLWWTVRRAVDSSRPALWFMSSLVLRVVLIMTGFYLVGQRQWQVLLVCVLGFVVARIVILRLTGPLTAAAPPATERIGHAP